VELGTQDELLAADGLYARLHRMQFADEIEHSSHDRALFDRMVSAVGRFESITGEVTTGHDDIAGEAAW